MTSQYDIEEILENFRDEDHIIDGKFPDMGSDVLSDRRTDMRNGQSKVIAYSYVPNISKHSLNLLPPTPSLVCTLPGGYVRGFVFKGEIPRGIRVIFGGTSVVYDTYPYTNPDIPGFVEFPLFKLSLSHNYSSSLSVTPISETDCELFEDLKIVRVDFPIQYYGASSPYNPKQSEFVVKNSQGGEKILRTLPSGGKIVFFDGNGVRYNPNSYIDLMGEFVGCYTKGVAR